MATAVKENFSREITHRSRLAIVAVDSADTFLGCRRGQSQSTLSIYGSSAEDLRTVQEIMEQYFSVMGRSVSVIVDFNTPTSPDILSLDRSIYSIDLGYALENQVRREREFRGQRKF